MAEKRQRSIIRMVIMAIALTTILCACNRQASEQTEAEQSAFAHYVDSLNSQQMEQALQILLKNDTSSWKSDITVKQHYADMNDFSTSPLWFTRLGVKPEADSLLAILRRELPLAGLDSTAFHVPQIAADLQVTHQLAFDSLGLNINEVLPRLDYHLTKAFVRYCTGQRYGFMRPDRTFNKLEYKPHTKDKVFARLFDYGIFAPDYEEVLRHLTDEHLISYIQESRPQGKVYEALHQRMMSTNDSKERQKLALNMERCRWQLKIPFTGERNIIVNIAAQQLWVVSPDTVINMRICCGAVTNKTPLLCSEISHMQVNPDWIVPQNIIKTDFLHHEGDSAYFARNRYYIVERSTGDTLRPADVSAEEMESGLLRIGQHGGEGNSLGRIVFRFANDFGIYLHDTNNRKAFDRERRTLSHGCIRVQKPFELACYLLPEADEWLLERMRLSMDIKPETERGTKYLKEHEKDTRPLRLITYQGVSPHVPVYIIYYTMYPNPITGEVDSWPDLYNYDKVMYRELHQLLQK